MPTDDILAIVGRADDLYRQRARPGAVRESVMVLSGARAGSDKYEVQWRLARSMFFLGEEACSIDGRRHLYHTAITAGERAVRLNPGRVEGHFWVGVNLALYAESVGGIRGARALRWAMSELRMACQISEGYHGAGPLRVLARVEHKAPKFLGGNRKLSRGLYDRALALAPSNTVTLIYAAELAIDEGEHERAKALLEQVLSLPEDPEWQYECCRDRNIAKALLERLGKAQHPPAG